MKPQAQLTVFRGLLPVLRPEWRGMLVGYLIGTLSALALASLSVLAAWAVGHAIVEGTMPSGWWWTVMTVLVLLRTVLTWQEMDVSHALAYRVLARLRMALFDSYARSVPGRRREHSGRAASVAMDDIEKLEFFYAHTTAQLGSSLTVVFATAVTAFALLPAAGIVMIGGSLLVASSALYGARTARRIGEQEHQQRSALSAQIVDALGALREILGHGLTPRIVAETDIATARATTISRRRELLAQLNTTARELTVTAVVIGVIAASAAAAGVLTDTEENHWSPAALPALIALALIGIAACAEATATLTQLHPLTANATRVTEGLHRPTVVTIPAHPRPLPAGAIGMRFHEVSFAYEDRPAALTSWSMQIRAGEHVGLAGPSGSGKSTILALAARLWEPESGHIDLIDAHGAAVRLSDADEAELRKAIAFVDQDATLFHGTVRDNLLRGVGPLPDNDLTRILESTGVAEWISLDDELGQSGIRLSGGQQARLCLARALVRQPRLLLIDEVTASLDPATERTISDVIADYAGTVLIASHRPETLARLGRIIELTRPEGLPRR